MAHPGPNQKLNQRLNQKKQEIYDTKNFDKIDYIVQIPLIDNPNDRQSRFLLAMDYTLPPRSGLGIMDTALEHMLHYYDMKKVELIFCEMWQSVCLFIEFHDIPSSMHAYNQLFQFFKTIFYVEDLSNLEEIWICGHCKHYNQFDDNFRGKMNSINDMASKRKNAKGDEYIYWCNRCKNVNVPSYKKIKYSYQKIKSLININHQKKSNRVQIGSISRIRQYSDPPNLSYSVSPPPPSSQYQQQQQQHPSSHAKSQPIISISKESAISAQINDHDHDQVIFPAGNLGKFGKFDKETHGGNNHVSDIKSDDDDNNNDSGLRTPGTHLMMGHAVGNIKFNNNNNNNNNNNYPSSSPEIISPQSSVSIQATIITPSDITRHDITRHDKKYSVDSQISLTSTTSAVSTVDNSLDLCLNIIENIDLNPINNNNNLHQLNKQKQQVVDKIAKLTNMLNKIQNTFTFTIDDNQENEIDIINFNEVKQEENNNNNLVYRNIVNNKDKDYTQENTLLFSDGDDINNPPTTPQYDNDSNSNSNHTINDDNDNNDNNDWKIKTPHGKMGQVLMGQAIGSIPFKL